MTLDELQEMIARMYSRKDEARGVEGTFMWLMEEIGELAAALRESPKEDIAKEFADVLAWLATIANVAGIIHRHNLAQGDTIAIQNSEAVHG